MKYRKEQAIQGNWFAYKLRVAKRMGVGIKGFTIKDGYVIFKSKMNYYL